jgi:hypothetical protein
LDKRKLAKSSTSYYTTTVRTERGYQDLDRKLRPYHESIKMCRYFYRYDPLASTVVNRLAEISATQIRNKRKSFLESGESDQDVYNLFQTVAYLIQPYISNIILSYLIDGMAIPQYELTRIQGNRVNKSLGRTRYFLPHSLWLRDPDTIKLYRTVKGHDRRAIVEIPGDDINFILTGGRRSDGEMDIEAYNQLISDFPDYVKLVKEGNYKFAVNDYIIYRKLMPFNDYPIPFLENALESLDHKRYLKLMDKAIASRAIEAFRHISVGSDDYPADDEDIKTTEDSLNQQSSTERVYNLFTNHTVKINWVVPPYDALLSDKKYDAANIDIFFALGFPRILVVGETERSNSADNRVAMLGVLSTIQDIQKDVLQWVRHLYRKVAEANNLTKIPDPYFSQVSLADASNLIQYLTNMLEKNVISKDTAASFYSTDFETEAEQISYEQDVMPTPVEPNQNTEQVVNLNNLQDDDDDDDDSEDIPEAEAAAAVPQWMRNNARRGLKWHEEGKSGAGVVAATIREAREMASGRVSAGKAKKMAAWFARHMVDLNAPAAKPGHPEYPSPGVVAHALWGGGSKSSSSRAMAWARARSNQSETENANDQRVTAVLDSEESE